MKDRQVELPRLYACQRPVGTSQEPWFRSHISNIYCHNGHTACRGARDSPNQIRLGGKKAGRSRQSRQSTVQRPPRDDGVGSRFVPFRAGQMHLAFASISLRVFLCGSISEQLACLRFHTIVNRAPRDPPLLLVYSLKLFISSVSLSSVHPRANPSPSCHLEPQLAFCFFQIVYQAIISTAQSIHHLLPTSPNHHHHTKWPPRQSRPLCSTQQRISAW
jgi:hypothetical protein